MTAGRRTIIGLGIVGLGGIVVALAIATRGPAPRAEAAAEAATPAGQPPVAAPADWLAAGAASGAPAAAPVGSALAEAPTAEGPTVDDILQARADDSADALTVLLAGVESRDAVVVAESTNALVARGAVAALPVLVEHDVPGRPWAAPSVIDALGRLASVAAPEQRSEVVDRLVALMHQEKHRGAIESQGNLLQIYEALGLTGDAQAIEPLEHELVDPGVPTALKVVVVQALVALSATRSRGILEQLKARLAADTTADAYEAELQRDLLVVIRDALVKLS